MIFNVAFSIAVKAVQAVLGFAIIHHLIASWGHTRYGTWVTMTSLIAYTSIFDFGVGYGIKNKIAEAHAVGRLQDAERHTIFGMLFYSAAAFLILVVGIVWIPNVAPFKENMVASVLLWFGFVVSFLLSYANIVLQALRRFGVSSGIGLVLPASWFVVVYAVDPNGLLSTPAAALIYAVLLVVQGVTLAAIAFRTWRFRIRGRLWESLPLARALLKTGGNFFILQVASLALFYSGTLMAFQFLGAAEVARFDAANKVFSMFSLGFSILVSVAWVEISRAKSSRDGARMRQVFIMLNIAAFAVCVAATAVAQFSSVVVGGLTNVALPSSDAYPFAAMVGLQAIAFSSAVYLNAFEKLRGQVVLAVLSVPLFFAVAYGLLRTGQGIGSIPLASAVATLPATLFCILIAIGLIRSVRSERDGELE